MTKPKAITTPGSLTPTPPTIAALGEAIQGIVDATDVHKQDDENRNRTLWDLQRQYEERIFWMLAETPEDALVQIARLSAELEAFDYESENEDTRNRSYLALMRATDRALYSIVRWIERAHNVKQRPEVMDFYMAERMDPWNVLAAYAVVSDQEI